MLSCRAAPCRGVWEVCTYRWNDVAREFVAPLVGCRLCVRLCGQFVGCRGRHNHTYLVEWADNRVATVLRGTNHNLPDMSAVRSYAIGICVVVDTYDTQCGL